MNWIIDDEENTIASIGSGSAIPENVELRADGSYELRSDGGYELRA